MSRHRLYGDRHLSQGYPNLEAEGVAHYRQAQQEGSRTSEILDCVGRLIDIGTGLRTAVVVGCGPNPRALRTLLDRGWDAVGVEPLAGSAAAAVDFVGDPARVKTGVAERLPVPDESQRLVLMESVLEHVDSPLRSLREACRVLAPGGVLYVYTTNRHRFSWKGANPEFRTPFFNWFPRVVKEAYVHHHLHFDPRLAHFSPRPAVHWFTYAELCGLGRTAGFSQFYSPLDLFDAGATTIRRSRLRRAALEFVRTRPWARAAALVQFGGAIFMLRRSEGG